jgi:glutamate-5-semialdehyde dehydrogenase
MMELKETLHAVRKASRRLVLLSDDTINEVLHAVAESMESKAQEILVANQKDLDRMDVNNPKYDRLMLTPERIAGIAHDMRQVSAMKSPLGKVLRESTRPNGMLLQRVSVPFGVIGIIYEARPNVTFDVFALCLKSGNACVLKGGSDADATNQAIMAIIHAELERYGLDPAIATLLPSDRATTAAMLTAVDYIDVIIPRGSSQLIQFVRDHSTVPVIETGAGIVHTYFDSEGDVNKGKAIIHNAKTRRVSVCNALDCLIIHENRVKDLPQLCAPLIDEKVTIYADEAAYPILEVLYPKELLKHATKESYGTEFLDYKLSIKTIDTFEGALKHIQRYSSKHSECIITENKMRAEAFTKRVDAACVYVNVATSFTDGAQFGLGAEIGISTQKLHARGPMGLEELTTYKWIITGKGQIRES